MYRRASSACLRAASCRAFHPGRETGPRGACRRPCSRSLEETARPATGTHFRRRNQETAAAHRAWNNWPTCDSSPCKTCPWGQQNWNDMFSTLSDGSRCGCESRRESCRGRSWPSASVSSSQSASNDCGMTRIPASGGHEVRVAVPPRHDMPMHVARQACAGNLPEVQSHVEPFGPDRSFQQPDHLGDRLHQVELLGRFELVQAGDVALGGDQQMTIVIGVAIQHRQRILAMLHDQPVAIVVAGRCLAEEAGGISAGEHSRRAAASLLPGRRRCMPVAKGPKAVRDSRSNHRG